LKTFPPSRKRPGHVRMSGRPCRRKQQKNEKKRRKKKRRKRGQGTGEGQKVPTGPKKKRTTISNYCVYRLSLLPTPITSINTGPRGVGRKTPRPLHVAKRVPRFYMCKRCKKNVQAKTVTKKGKRGARFDSAHVQPFAVPVSH